MVLLARRNFAPEAPHNLPQMPPYTLSPPLPMPYTLTNTTPCPTSFTLRPISRLYATQMPTNPNQHTHTHTHTHTNKQPHPTQTKCKQHPNPTPPPRRPPKRPGLPGLATRWASGSVLGGGGQPFFADAYVCVDSEYKYTWTGDKMGVWLRPRRGGAALFCRCICMCR